MTRPTPEMGGTPVSHAWRHASQFVDRRAVEVGVSGGARSGRVVYIENCCAPHGVLPGGGPL